MELVTLVVSGFLSILSNGGWITESIAEKTLRSHLESVEKLEVRIDNRPSYQLVDGKVEKLRIATRGVFFQPDCRIESLELETEPIALNLNNLAQKQDLETLRESLEKPLQTAIQVTLKEEDLAQALQSEILSKKLQETFNSIIASKAGNPTITYELLTPTLELLPSNRMKVGLKLRRSRGSLPFPALQRRGLRETVGQDRDSELAIAIELGVKVIAGKRIQLVNPTGTVNNRPMSQRLLQGFAEGISDRLDLTTIEKSGILARLLQLEITEDKIELVGFARIETKSVKNDSTEEVKP